MPILNIIAIIIIAFAVYAGDLRHNPGRTKPIYWILLAAGAIIIIISEIISM